MAKIKTIVLGMILITFAAGCANGGATLSEPQATATPTPFLINEPSGDIRPDTGLISLEFLDAETQLACVADFPFSIEGGGDTAVITGAGEINCPFSTEQCGEACVTYHIEYLFEGDLSGDIKLSTDPGQLQAELILDGTLTQFWTDIPPDSVMAFTEDHPMVLESADILPLIFDFEDGAVFIIENTYAPGASPWVFTLHLGQ